MFEDEKTGIWDYRWMIVAIVGVLIIACMLNYIPASYDKVNATVDMIGSVRDEKEDEDYYFFVYVNYKYKGKEYNHVKYNEIRVAWKRGEKITVYVNPDNPTELYTNRAARFFAMVVILLIISYIEWKREKVLRER